jgi:tRNA (guanine-N7-)-methyltransferase
MEHEETKASTEEMSEARMAHEAMCQAFRDQLKASLAGIFREPVGITLEIGSGHGHYLAAYAEAHPEEVCVGIDIVTKRVKKGESKRDKRGLEHLMFIKAEALEFLDALPEFVTLDKIFILFPDPWPKKRHWKNRVVQQPLLDKLAARTKPGAMLYLRTDHTGYFDWMKEEVAANASWTPRPEVPWPFEAPSFFQNLMDSWQSLPAERVAGK